MASSSLGHEELRDFHESVNTMLNQIQRSLTISDPICIDHCKNKLQNYISILAAISATVNYMSQSQQEQTEGSPLRQSCILASDSIWEIK